MATIRQPSFAGGELAPDFEGSDVEQVATGVKLARNFFVSRSARLISRPGTTYVNEVKDSAGAVRFIPFIAGEAAGQNYLLEFGAGYIRFHTSGGTVLSGASPYEVVSPYLEADLPRLKYSQVGDVLVLTHPSYTARELVRAGHTSWTLSTVSHDVPVFFGTDARLQSVDAVGDSTHPVLAWTWVVTSLGRTATGAVVESVAHTVTLKSDGSAAPTSAAVYADSPAIILLYGATTFPAGVRSFIGYRIYRGRNNAFGFVGEKLGSTAGLTWFDFGSPPDYSAPPPQGRNPFRVYDEDGTTELRVEEPVAVVHHEGRRVYGGTAERPTTVFASQMDSYNNFDERIPSTDDEAVEITIASNKREELRSLVSTESALLGFSDAAVWALRGSGGFLSAAAMNTARAQARIGASWLDPLEVDGDILYVRTKGYGVRSLAYSDEAGRFGGGDLSVLAGHLFEGFEVVDWTFAEDPYGIVWAVRDDGVLLSLTYSRQLGAMFAWTQHEMGGDGIVENVCALPEGSMDAVYLCVRRTIGGATKRYIERMTDRRTDVARLDCSASYSGTATSTITGLSHLEGLEVYAVADTQVVGPLTVSAGAVDLGITEGASTVYVGLAVNADVELLSIPAAITKRKIVKAILWEVINTRGLKTGEDFDSLTEWRQRTVADGYSPPDPESTLVETRLSARYSLPGRAVLRQEDPLPITIVAVSREGVVGG